MKLGEGGEAFFVFETFDDVPEGLQTSPVVSPAASPRGLGQQLTPSTPLQEPDFLDISTVGTSDRKTNSNSHDRPGMAEDRRTQSDLGITTGKQSTLG